MLQPSSFCFFFSSKRTQTEHSIRLLVHGFAGECRSNHNVNQPERRDKGKWSFVFKNKKKIIFPETIVRY